MWAALLQRVAERQGGEGTVLRNSKSPIIPFLPAAESSNNGVIEILILGILAL